jgi:hypothetical protein
MPRPLRASIGEIHVGSASATTASCRAGVLARLAPSAAAALAGVSPRSISRTMPQTRLQRIPARLAPDSTNRLAGVWLLHLDQKLTFGAGDNVATDDNLAGDVDL